MGRAFGDNDARVRETESQEWRASLGVDAHTQHPSNDSAGLTASDVRTDSYQDTARACGQLQSGGALTLC